MTQNAELEKTFKKHWFWNQTFIDSDGDDVGDDDNNDDDDSDKVASVC